MSEIPLFDQKLFQKLLIFTQNFSLRGTISGQIRKSREFPYLQFYPFRVENSLICSKDCIWSSEFEVATVSFAIAQMIRVYFRNYKFQTLYSNEKSKMIRSEW